MSQSYILAYFKRVTSLSFWTSQARTCKSLFEICDLAGRKQMNNFTCERQRQSKGQARKERRKLQVQSINSSCSLVLFARRSEIIHCNLLLVVLGVQVQGKAELYFCPTVPLPSYWSQPRRQRCHQFWLPHKLLIGKYAWRATSQETLRGCYRYSLTMKPFVPQE